MTKKLNAAILALMLTMAIDTCIVADLFRPIGTEAYFSVDSQTLSSTPKWDPSMGDISFTANDAIRVATKFHESLRFTGFRELHRWSFHRAILTCAGDDRWYWIITFRGLFDPTLFKLPVGTSGGFSYPGTRTLYNHYPVLLTGSMPNPIIESDAEKKSRINLLIRNVNDDEQPFDFNGLWPLPNDSDTDGG